nr:hypothetical protein [Clostridia bacterium]
VNRHDSSPENGFAVTEEEMRRDLELIKDANCNTIRTSHYPPDPRFAEMCLREGIMLVDEADLETHGMGYNTDDDWDWFRWSALSDSPEWKKAYVDRAASLYERDKNLGNVILWSLGNESGCGANHRAMREYIRGRRPTALIHYENAHLEFKAVPPGEDFSDISDVESRMYAGIDYIKEYLARGMLKPFFMCEYVDSMTTGEINDYISICDEHDSFSGGCVWEWCDHAVSVPAPDGSRRYYYGGDFGDHPNDRISCLDGLVFPDRSLRPGYYDMQKAYSPIKAYCSEGRISLFSRFVYTSRRVNVELRVSTDGEWDDPSLQPAVLSFGPLTIGPRQTVELDAGVSDIVPESGFYALNVRVFSEEGKMLCCEDVDVCQCPPSCEIKTVSVSSKDDGCFYRVYHAGTEFVFDKRTGRLISIMTRGRELLTAPVDLNVFRPRTYNGGSFGNWADNDLANCYSKCCSFEVDECSDGAIVTVTGAHGSPSRPPVLRYELSWEFRSDSPVRIRLRVRVDTRDSLKTLPRIGLLFRLAPEFEKIRYFGPGPLDSYPDRHGACSYGVYETTARDNFVHYLRPQENGEHFGVRSLTVGDGADELRFLSSAGMPFFSFGASLYSDSQIAAAAHDFELKEENSVFVKLDFAVGAINDGSAAARSARQLLPCAGEHEYEILMEV